MAKELSYEEVVQDLKKKSYKPVYCLMGEESYYIDRIADYIGDSVLNEIEKEFNLTVLYGSEVDVSTITLAAKRYPMMSEHQVVIVKEAQSIKKIEELVYYVQKPLHSTILVLCYKNGTLDRRKKLASEVQKAGVLFESKRLKEGQLPAFISTYLKRKGVEIEPKAIEMLADFVGTDLSRMAGELDKLIITLSSNARRITPAQIEENIGISKDYNNFELRNALVAKNVFKANQIVKYFNDNPRLNPLQMTLAILFNFYSNLMLAYYAPEKSEQGVASQLGLKSPWQAREYISAMKSYSGVKVMQIIGEIRYCDAKSKGVGNSSLSHGELLKELVYKIIH
ncbi:MAG: DNA polymerase III subunit delta [Phocaeicola sp.]